MKTLIRKSVIASVFFLTLVISGVQSYAQNNNVFVYDRTLNNSIAIASDNAVGCSYQVKDKKGNTVMSGKIKSANFNIPTSKLSNGTYHFTINGKVLQQFIVK